MTEDTASAEPEEVTPDLTFVPKADIPRLYTCDVCGDQYISPNALAAHHVQDH